MLLFAAGTRPSVADVVRLAESGGAFAITHAAESDGWVEALVTGLTFEVHGLATAPGEVTGKPTHRFGLTAADDLDACEAVAIRAGSHLAGGESMVPVVRGLVALGAALSDLPGVKAIAWTPARSVMSRAHFAASVEDWLTGGPFPALGLIAWTTPAAGVLRSEGLAYFIGQELELAPNSEQNQADRMKLAIRAVHALVTGGSLTAPTRLAMPGGEPLLAEPSPDGRTVRIGRRP